VASLVQSTHGVMRVRVLVFAHQVAIRAALARTLMALGYGVEVASSEKTARQLTSKERFAAAIVAARSGATDEFALIHKLSDAADKLVLLAEDADAAQRLTRSFPEALICSSQQLDYETFCAFLGNSAQKVSAPPSASKSEFLHFAGRTLDVTGRVFLDANGHEVALTRGEFALLVGFARNPGQVLSRAQLRNGMGSGSVDAYNRSIDMLVARLRRKIEPEPAKPQFISTIPGVGYKFFARVHDGGPTTGAPSAAPDQVGNASEAPRVERRHVTVLSCQILGLAELTAKLDPEDLQHALSPVYAACARIVARFGGTMLRTFGDDVLAYFGYPKAQENDAESAVRAALELLRALRTNEAPIGNFRARIGIANGLMVVSELLDGGAQRQPTAIGAALNLALYMQKAAPAEGVVIAASTRRLVGDLFEYRNLGAVEAKGFAEPVPAWQVLRESAVESRFEALHSAGMTALVGREEEIELLLRRWQRAEIGYGQVALISGEPGIGKSRVVAALQERIANKPHVRLRYFCSPHHGDSALHPIIAHFERAAGFGREDTAEARLGKLKALLASTLPTDEKLAFQDTALLAELLSIPTDCYPALDFAPERKKKETFSALLRQIGILAQQQPVLMLFEDLHWIDPSSRELLDLVVEFVPRSALLLLVTFRTEYTPPWIGQPHVTALTLSRLDHDEGASLVQRIVGNRLLPDEMIAEIVERTDGVPLFVEELTKAVLEAEASEASTGTIANVASPARAVPVTLHASLMARLDRLGPAVREVAQIGAAVGREFSYELLEAAAASPDPAELRPAVTRLVDAGLVFQRGALPQATFLFKHALVQDAAYSTLLRAARQHLHGRIAVVLEDQFSDLVQAQPELLARHLTEAGLSERAIDYWLKAGQLAAARSAHVEAVSHLTRGLTLVRELASGTNCDRWELQLQCVLAPALNATKGYAAIETVDAYERARELIAITGEIEGRDAVLNGLSAAYYNRGEFGNVLTVARECLRTAETGGKAETALLCVGYRFVAAFHNATGNCPAALEHAQRALACFDPQRHGPLAWRYAHDLGVAAMVQTALALTDNGFPTQGAALSAEALARAVRLNHPNSMGYALFYGEAMTALKRRDAQAVGEHATRLAAHGREHRLPQWVAWGMCLQGPALTVSARAEAAVERIEAGIAACDRMQNEAFRPTFHAALAEALGALGRRIEALRAVADGIDAAARTGERWMLPELYRIQGVLLMSSHEAGSREAADGCFRRGVEEARRQGSKLQELRTATSLAQLWRDQSKLSEARALLAPLYGSFTEGFDTVDLKQAWTLLVELA